MGGVPSFPSPILREPSGRNFFREPLLFSPPFVPRGVTPPYGVGLPPPPFPILLHLVPSAFLPFPAPMSKIYSFLQWESVFPRWNKRKTFFPFFHEQTNPCPLFFSPSFFETPRKMGCQPLSEIRPFRVCPLVPFFPFFPIPCKATPGTEIFSPGP